MTPVQFVEMVANLDTEEELEALALWKADDVMSDCVEALNRIIGMARAHDRP